VHLTYPHLTLDVVKTLTNGTSTESAMEVLGQPNHYFGSGMVGSVYKLVDGTEVTVYFSNGVIDQIRIYHMDGSYDIIIQ
jgi:hypothetical protein